VKVFPLAANGNVAPTRTIAGSNTGIHDIAGIALDTQGELYVADGGAGTVVAAGSILVFKSGATGNVAPIRTIAGANTQITSPSSIAVDSDGTIYVGENNQQASSAAATETFGSILRFAAGASGNSSPESSVTTTELVHSLILDASDTNVIYAGSSPECCQTDILTIPKMLTTSTSIADLAKIDGANFIAADPTNASYYTNFVLDLADTTSGLYLPPMGSHDYFSPAPLGSLDFACTANGIAVDLAGDLVVSSSAGSAPCAIPAIDVYAADQSDSAIPMRTVSGSATTLVNPLSIATGP
jgi:hypothetical protein